MLTALDLTGEAYHQTAGDVDVLKRIAGQLPPDPVIVNIGACFGTSAMAFLEARPDCFIFSVDIKPSPKETEHLRQSALDHKRVVRCLGRSQDIGKHWPRKVDLVYVDGSHDYKDVLADIDAWLPHIKPGGVMLFHDYGKAICPSVKPAVDEQMWQYSLILHEDSMIAFRI